MQGSMHLYSQKPLNEYTAADARSICACGQLATAKQPVCCWAVNLQAASLSSSSIWWKQQMSNSQVHQHIEQPSGTVGCSHSHQNASPSSCQPVWVNTHTSTARLLAQQHTIHWTPRHTATRLLLNSWQPVWVAEKQTALPIMQRHPDPVQAPAAFVTA